MFFLPLRQHGAWRCDANELLITYYRSNKTGNIKWYISPSLHLHSNIPSLPCAWRIIRCGNKLMVFTNPYLLAHCLSRGANKATWSPLTPIRSTVLCEIGHQQDNICGGRRIDICSDIYCWLKQRSRTLIKCMQHKNYWLGVYWICVFISHNTVVGNDIISNNFSTPNILLTNICLR